MTRSVVLWAAALGLWVAGASTSSGQDAAADPVDTESVPYFDRLWQSIESQLELAIADNRRKPPEPVEVTWKRRRLGTIDLGAPILDIVARDLDGDSRAELIALTTTHVEVLRQTGRRKLARVARAELPATPAPIRSRAPVGLMVVTETGEIRARTSDQAEGLVATFSDDALSVTSVLTGWPLCADGTAELIAGQAMFDQGAVAWPDKSSYRSIDRDFVSARCRSGLVDAAGYHLELFGFVDDKDSLVVRCNSQRGTCPWRERVYDDVGYAFEIADIDNDGTPEVITTSNKPYAGLDDRVTVQGTAKPLSTRKFGGGVVAVTAGDVDADGVREVIAAVRLAGATRVNLWTLN